MSIKGAKLIDFTGTAAGFEQHEAFGEAVTKSLRNGAGNKVVVVLDRGTFLPVKEPHLVLDHINLTGDNPLRGPNNPCGERFPVVNGIYVTDFGGSALKQLPRGVLGGLKAGTVPTAAEMKRLRELGVDFCSYNLVQTMIVAAHAGWKVAAIVLPEGAKLDGDLLTQLSEK
ncbi:MAG: hypothetical protein ACRD3W_16730 [Terriglobales bacterium]